MSVQKRAYDLANFAIEITIALVVIAIIIGDVGFNLFFKVNKTPFDATTQLIWPFIALMVVVGLIIAMLKKAQSSQD